MQAAIDAPPLCGVPREQQRDRRDEDARRLDRLDAGHAAEGAADQRNQRKAREGMDERPGIATPAIEHQIVRNQGGRGGGRSTRLLEFNQRDHRLTQTRGEPNKKVIKSA